MAHSKVDLHFGFGEERVWGSIAFSNESKDTTQNILDGLGWASGFYTTRFHGDIKLIQTTAVCEMALTE